MNPLHVDWKVLSRPQSEDQSIFLKIKLTFSNCWIIFFVLQKKIRYTTGDILTEEEALESGFDSELISVTVFFIDQLKSITLDHTEFCVIQAVMLTFGRALKLEQRNKVVDMQSHFMRCLCAYVKKTYPNQPLRFDFCSCLIRMRDQQKISKQAQSNA